LQQKMMTFSVQTNQQKMTAMVGAGTRASMVFIKEVKSC
jgi:hypothetical protein